MSDTTNMPRFRVEGKETNSPKLIIQCSKCEKDIRYMEKTERIKVDRGIYCTDCDDGAIHLNMPRNT